MDNFIEEESRLKQNPFERPKPKILNAQELKNNTNKKIQMQKVGNFRDQLNKSMLDNASKDSVSLQEVPEKKEPEEKPKIVETQKKYRIPPRININKDLESEPKKEEENFLNAHTDNILFQEKSQQDLYDFHSNVKSEQVHSINETATIEKNINVMDECNVSGSLSEKKTPIEKEGNLLLETSSLSIQNKKGINTRNDSQNDLFNGFIQNVNDDIKRNNKTEYHNTAPLKPSNVQINPNSNKRALVENTNSNSNPKSQNISLSSQSEGKSAQIDRPLIESETNNQENLIDIIPTNDGENNTKLTNQENTNPDSNTRDLYPSLNDIHSDNLHTSQVEIENFSELLKKLELLKNEIRDLKHSKIALQSNYDVEVNKNKMYQTEIEELRKSIKIFKLKEIKEGEAMLKLEIKNLSYNIDYHKKTNNLLQIENDSLKNEVKKLQDYLTEMIKMKNENGQITHNKLKEDNSLHIHQEYVEENEDEKELNAPLNDNEEEEPELEQHVEVFDQDTNNYVLPLETYDEEPKESLVDELKIKEENNVENIIQENKIEDTKLIPDENLMLQINEIKPTVQVSEHSEHNYTNEENNHHVEKEKSENGLESQKYLNYSFEMNKNTQEVKLEEESNDLFKPTMQKNIFNDFEESYPTNKQSNLWDVIEEQKPIPNKKEKVSANPFEENYSKTSAIVENVFNNSSQIKSQLEKKIIPAKKESSISANIMKQKNVFKDDKKNYFDTPQNHTEKKLFELTSDLSDDVFSSISQENIKPDNFKKNENTNLNRKNNVQLGRPQTTIQKPQDPFANKKNTKLMNLQYNADEDIGSIFGTLARNENKGNNLFD